MAVDLAQVIPPLVRAKLDFILIDGMAAILHGSARVTFDVEVFYSRTHHNIERLTTALAPHRPYLRNAPSGLPFAWDTKTIRNGLNLLSPPTLVISTCLAKLLWRNLSDAPAAFLRRRSFRHSFQMH